MSICQSTSNELDLNYNIVASLLHSWYSFGYSGPWL